MQKLKIPQDAAKAPITLTAKIDILVCKEECIPEEGLYVLKLKDPSQATLPANAADALPKPLSAPVTFSETNGDLILKTAANATHAEFFPDEWGVIVNAAKSETKSKDGQVTFRQKRDQRALSTFSELKGVLTLDNKSYVIAAKKDSSLASSAAPKNLENAPLIQTILFALLGGVILNLMPCVFPVLSIKALSLVKISEKHPKLARMHGIAYTSGVITSFLAIAALLISLRAAGSEIGWGFQLQNPIVVTLLAWLLFVIGLNLAGLFEISGGLGNVGNKLTTSDNLKGSFFTGILATLVATPCTAPFMGVAIGVALLQPPAIALLIFATLGFGLALPYLALSFMPSLRKILPRPGAWMDIFKQFLAFPMFASTAWLIWVLSQQAGSMGVFGAVMGLVFISFGIWLLRHAPRKKYWRYKVRILALASFIFAFFLLPATHMEDMHEANAPANFSQAWSPEKLDASLNTRDPVFVEMTAAWCITCKVNHAVAIDRDATRKLFAAKHVHYLIGDWTNQDNRITEYLNSFGRNGVPVYIYYAAPDASGKRPAAKILPQVLTTGIVADAVQ